VAPTVFLHRWRLRARSIDTGDDRVPEMSVLRMCQLFAADYPAFYRDLDFGHLARECADICGVHQAAGPLDVALAHARHRNVIPDIRSVGPEDLGFLDMWLTRTERYRLPGRPGGRGPTVLPSGQVQPGPGGPAGQPRSAHRERSVRSTSIQSTAMSTWEILAEKARPVTPRVRITGTIAGAVALRS